MNKFLFLVVASILLLGGCKTECDDCKDPSQAPSNNVNEVSDHFVPYWKR